MKTFLTLLLGLCLLPSYAQSDIDKIVRGGELLLGGLTLLKVARSDPKPDAKSVETFCVRNKTKYKLHLVLECIDPDKEIIKKELVVPADAKDCLLELAKGRYTYILYMPDGEIYKKGECKVEDSYLLSLKEP